MGESIKSFILLLLIAIILGILLVLGLDIFGIITLPEEYSIKKYITYTGNQTVALVSENIVSYPKEYYVDENTNTTENKENMNAAEILNSTAGKINNDTVTDSGIVYGANRSYYYNQLNTYAKTLYNEMYKNLDNLKTGTYVIEYGDVFNDLLNTSSGERTLTDAFQLAINALLLDYPEIFYLDVTKMYMYTEMNQTLFETTYKISIGPEEGTNYLHEGFESKVDVLLAEEKINGMVYSITSGFHGSTYDKIKMAHDYLVDNLRYDENDSGIHSHNIYGAFIENVVVCDGYAKAYKFLLDSMGIHCVQVCGIATNSAGSVESHTWNYVLINGMWYAIDVTWDDPIITGGGFLTDTLKYKNFLCGSDTFFKNHTEDGYVISNGCFSYPTLSKNNY